MHLVRISALKVKLHVAHQKKKKKIVVFSELFVQLL